MVKKRKARQQKWLCLIASMICMLGLSLQVRAEELKTQYVDDPGLFVNEGTFPAAPSKEVQRIIESGKPGKNGRRIREAGVSFEDYLVSQIEQKSTRIDIADYNISVTEISRVYAAVVNRHPELFYLNSGFRYSYVPTTQMTIALEVTYQDIDIDAVNAVIDDETDRMLALIRDDMSDAEKVLAVHDHLCVEIEYAYREFLEYSQTGNESAVPRKRHTLEGALVDKMAVCDGYSNAFLYFMNELGIPCNLMTGQAGGGGHAWNQVRLDGKWYLVDVTWDDPTWDFYGNVSHTNFLVDEANLDDHSWTKADYETCTSTDYMTAFWRDTETQCLYRKGDWYYVSSDGKLKKHNFTRHGIQEAGELVKEIGGRWPAVGQAGYYSGNYCRIAARAGKLYYTQPAGIYTCRFDGTEETKLLDADTSNGYIYGMKIKGDTLHYQVGSAPYGEQRTPFDRALPIENRIADAVVTLTPQRFVYDETKEEQLANPSVSCNGRILEYDEDYVIFYKYPDSGVGTVTYRIVGINDYEGEQIVTYEIEKANQSITGLTSVIEKTYGDASFALGAAAKGSLTYASGNEDVAEVSAEGMVTVTGAGTAVITVTAADTECYHGTSASVTISVERAELPGTVYISPTEFIYNGQAQTPNIRIPGAQEGVNLQKDVDYTVGYENNINAGTAKILIEGIGNYKGGGYVSFEIEKADQTISIASESVNWSYGDGPYALDAHAPGGCTYVSGNENIVTVDEEGNATITGVGTTTITVQAPESQNYREADSRTIAVTVNRGTLSGVLRLEQTNLAYTGSPLTPHASIEGLVEGRDYRLTYENNVQPGLATVTATGIGNYQGTLTAQFSILSGQMIPLEGTVKLSQNVFVYTGEALEPDVQVGNLRPGVDYEVIYTNNINVGTASVQVVGKGVYEGMLTAEFTIKKAVQTITAGDITKNYGDLPFSLNVSAPGLLSYESSDPSVAAVDAAGNVTLGRFGSAVITIYAAETENYESAIRRITVNVKARPLAGKMTLSQNVFCYDGTSHTPNVTIEGLKAGVDYLVYYENNINIGKAAAVAAGIGNYAGSLRMEFTILDKQAYLESLKGQEGNHGQNPVVKPGDDGNGEQAKKPAKVKKVSAKSSRKKKVTLKWKKQDCSGYRIQISRKKNFKKLDKKLMVRKGKTVKKTVSGLKSGKIYYIRIQAYKKVGGTTVYGAFSRKVKVKIR